MKSTLACYFATTLLSTSLIAEELGPVKSAASNRIKTAYKSLDHDDIRRLPIGVFDSGTGGLTVLEQILTIDAFENHSNKPSTRGDGKTDFCNESFIFLADQANMPYGNYPVVGKKELLEDLIVKDAWFLMGRSRFKLFEDGGQVRFREAKKSPVKAIVIACNTATAYGQDDIEEVIASAGLDIKVVGVIDAGAKGAVESLNGQDGTIGVVPTKGTVLSGAYPDAIKRIAKKNAPDLKIVVVQQGAFGLAGAIDGSREFILTSAKNNRARADYRGPSITHASVKIDPSILGRYAFDFSNHQMLLSGSPAAPTELQLNSVENYISYHLVSLLDQIRQRKDAPPLRAIVLGCTHFPFFKESFNRQLQRLRNYQEGGKYVYRPHMAKAIKLIDPAFYTARELYQGLAADKRVRSDGHAVQNRGEFCITVPSRQDVAPHNVTKYGELTYEYKYGRETGKVASAFKAVSLNGRTVDPAVLQRLQRQVPTVWSLLKTSSSAHATTGAKQKIDRIEKLIAEDIGSRRGIEPLTKMSAGGLYAAAKSIADHPKPNVAIITGFFFPYSTPPSCETDGPPGAAHIALALHRAGIPCRVATDVVNERVVYSSLWGAGLPGDFPVDSISMDSTGKDGGVPLKTTIKAWIGADPPITHVISLERGGPASDGKPHNFSGDDISKFNAPLHRLFEAGDWVTIGIGDGGNEIGMGNLPLELVAKHVKNGNKVACVTKCDHLIVCGTSNWGGWALPTAVGLLRPDLQERLMRGINKKKDYQILKVAVEKGRAAALESFKAKRAYPNMSVDALPWKIHARKLEELLNIVNAP